MSDHPKEAKRTLKRIQICADGCFDIFRLLPHKKIGSDVAVVSDQFDALVDSQFAYRRWALGKLVVHSDRIVKLNEYGPAETLPFPQVPLPNSIIGFASVCVWSFDPNAIAFLQRISPLLKSNISLVLLCDREMNWDDFTTSILPQLSFSAIIRIHFTCFEFHHFRRVFSPSILRNCANLRTVNLFGIQCLQFPPNDSGESSDGQALCRWLHTPCADGQPKVLHFRWGDGFQLDQLKTHFLDATTPVNFIIILESGYSIHHSFELVNSVTREQMKCREIYDCWMIVRCSIDKNEKQWAEWEEEAVKVCYGKEWEVISIHV